MNYPRISIYKATVLAFVLLNIIACNQAAEEQLNRAEESDTANMSQELASENTTLNKDSLVSHIKERINQIEQDLPEPLEVSTESLRAKLRQKWDHIHYYEKDGELVRIKTYPHQNISERTEEFYLMNGQLIAVVIEDQGSGERGKSEEQLDKIYYFHNGELLREQKNTGEKEYGNESTDAQELMKEVEEYMEIYRSQK